MTIQKLSSGSKKNCRFFCVCRDLAGFVGQKVLENKKKHDREEQGDTLKRDNLQLILCFYRHEIFISVHLVTYCNISLFCYTTG